jgi:ADP-ribose pyrophosphatase YjhB (NUDIX family)
MAKKTAHESKTGGFRNPAPTADTIIELTGDEIVLIERKYEPAGWAIPGGFIDYGESAEAAARREAREETGLEVTLTGLLGVYSAPERDPRRHTLTVVYVATAAGKPVAADDARDVGTFKRDNLPSPIAFDHDEILADYFRYKDTGRLPKPHES